MPISEPLQDDGQLYTHVDDEQYDELSELNGQPIVHVSVWEEGLADSIPLASPANPGDDDSEAADIDLYLRDGVYFELYGTLCYTDLDAAAMSNLNEIEQSLQGVVKAGGVLEEVAVDDENGLVLVLAVHHQPLLYLQVGAWLLDEWEELPDTSAP